MSFWSDQVFLLPKKRRNCLSIETFLLYECLSPIKVFNEVIEKRKIIKYPSFCAIFIMLLKYFTFLSNSMIFLDSYIIIKVFIVKEHFYRDAKARVYNENHSLLFHTTLFYNRVYSMLYHNAILSNYAHY